VPGRRRGRRRARAAFSRNREAKRAVHADRGDHQVLHRVGGGEELVLDAFEIAVGQPDRDPVVGPDGGDLRPEPLPQARLDGHRPRRVDATAERRQQHEAPVAQLVPEALHDDAPVGRQGTGGLALILEVGDEVLGGEGVEVVPLAEPSQGGVATGGPRARCLDPAHERADRRPSSIGRPTASPFQNGTCRVGAGGRSPVRRDLGHRPASGPRTITSPCMNGPQLVEPLSSSSRPAGGCSRPAGDEDAVEATVGIVPPNVPATTRVAASLNRVGDADPDERGMSSANRPTCSRPRHGHDPSTPRG